MKVSTLIKKLQKMPQDAEIAVENTAMYINGTYKAIGVSFWEEENIVTIESDYVWIQDDGKWVKEKKYW